MYMEEGNIRQLELLHALGKEAGQHRTAPLAASEAPVPSSAFSPKSCLSRSDSTQSCVPVSGIILFSGP